MNSQNATKTIIKLNKATKDGDLTWAVASGEPASLTGTEKLLGSVYITQVMHKKLRLYKYQSKYFYDEDSFEWSEGYRLEFIDNWGNPGWQFEYDASILDLYDTVTFKISGVQDFFNNFLNEEN